MTHLLTRTLRIIKRSVRLRVRRDALCRMTHAALIFCDVTAGPSLIAIPGNVLALAVDSVLARNTTTPRQTDN